MVAAGRQIGRMRCWNLVSARNVGSGLDGLVCCEARILGRVYDDAGYGNRSAGSINGSESGFASELLSSAGVMPVQGGEGSEAVTARGDGWWGSVVLSSPM